MHEPKPAEDREWPSGRRQARGVSRDGNIEASRPKPAP
jgi:hypothetical protein